MRNFHKPRKVTHFEALHFLHHGYRVTINFLSYQGKILWIFERLYSQESLTEEEVILWLGISPRTARAWRNRTQSPDLNALLLLHLFRSGKILPAGWGRKGYEFKGENLTQGEKTYLPGSLSNSARTIAAT